MILITRQLDGFDGLLVQTLLVSIGVIQKIFADKLGSPERLK